MNGTGVLILEGTNTYSGNTVVSSGILQVGQSTDLVAQIGALQAAVTVNAGADSWFRQQPIDERFDRDQWPRRSEAERRRNDHPDCQ